MSKLTEVLSEKELAICGLNNLDEHDQRELFVAIKNSAGRRVFFTKRHAFFEYGGALLEDDFETYLEYRLRNCTPDRREAIKAQIMKDTIHVYQCLVDRACRNIMLQSNLIEP